MRVYETSHIDGGCDVSPTCQDCPLPECKYDNPVGAAQYRREAKDREVLEIMVRESLNVREAAIRFSVTERSIYRLKLRLL